MVASFRAWLGKIYATLRPRTLAGQTMLLVGLALLIVQLLAFANQYIASRNQWLSITAAPAVIRILEVMEPGFTRFPGLARGVLETREAAPPIGENAPQIAERAREMLGNAGVTVLDVRASVSQSGRHGQRQRLREVIRAERRPPRFLMRLSVQVAPQRWLTVQGQSPPAFPAPILNLILQTLVLYGATLLPLMWLSRRLSEPLTALTAAAGKIGSREPLEPLPERGSDDLRELSAAFNAMQGRIDAMLAEKDHMLGAIGHDLRTPLASLRLRVESVRASGERGKMIATIDEMRQMLDDILALARIGREREAPQRFDLANMAEAVVDDLAELGQSVTIGTIERAIVLAHPRGIRRALTNLADNAVKYGDCATVSIRRDGPVAVLTVDDEGPGIATDQVEAMFQPFTRLEESRSRETGGTGLGLAIVRAIASAEGGTITLANRPEGGLRAELRLPVL
jgi:signal transduction histidine kinase